MAMVKIGIIGYGNMGTGHASNICGGMVPNMEVAAVCDIAPARRKACQENYPEIPVFENAEDLFQSGLCDSVLIAVPHYSHPHLAMRALECGLHVMVEKPAGVYTKQVMEMNEAAEKSSQVFGIMYNQRTNPIYQKIRQLIQNGELGHIKRISWVITDWYRSQAYHDSSSWRSTWKDEGGGALINQNPHQLDLWQWMFGMPDKVTAFVSYGKYYDIEVEDDVTAYFEYVNGTTGTYITSTGEAPGTNRLEIACDRGRIVVEKGVMTFERNVISEREHNQINTQLFAKPECWKCEVPISGTGEGHVGILKNFTEAILSGKELIAKGNEGINGLTISNAIHLSSWKGETIDLNSFPHQEFYDILQEKIKNSTVDKSKITQKVADTKGTY